MKISQLLSDKSIKPKEKTQALSNLLLCGDISLADLTAFAENAKDAVKATCIESIEFATKQQASILDKQTFEFVVKSMTAKAPRIKWESAKVIGNTAHLFTDMLDTAIVNLLINSEHVGTVVRWSAAFALGEILKLKTKHNKMLLPLIESIVRREEKGSIKKIYAAALKKIEK